MLIKSILTSLSLLSGLLPIIFFLVFRNRNKEGRLWVIFAYAFTSFITDFVNHSFALPRQAIFYLFSFFTIIEYSLFAFFLYLNLESKNLKRGIVAGSALFFGFALYNIIDTVNYNFDALPASVECILVIIFCVSFFYEQINNTEVSFVYASKKFWIIVAILIYLSATLFLFISSMYLTLEERREYWFINSISNFLKNVLLSIAFMLPNHKTTSPIKKDSFPHAYVRPYN